MNEIQLHKDGSWSTQSKEEKKSQKIDKAPEIDVSIEIINDDVGKINILSINFKGRSVNNNNTINL